MAAGDWVAAYTSQITWMGWSAGVEIAKGLHVKTQNDRFYFDATPSRSSCYTLGYRLIQVHRISSINTNGAPKWDAQTQLYLAASFRGDRIHDHTSTCVQSHGSVGLQCGPDLPSQADCLCPIETTTLGRPSPRVLTGVSDTSRDDLLDPRRLGALELELWAAVQSCYFVVHLSGFQRTETPVLCSCVQASGFAEPAELEERT